MSIKNKSKLAVLLAASASLIGILVNDKKRKDSSKNITENEEGKEE